MPDLTGEANEQHGAALDAFVDFTEAVANATDHFTLAQEAVSILAARFPASSVGYYEFEEQLWKLRLSRDITPPELVAVLREGLPPDTPIFAEALRTRDVVFVDGWVPEEQGVEHTQMYSATALCPVQVHGETLAMFAVGLRRQTQWSVRDRAMVRAVGKGLSLAWERLRTTERIVRQNAELDARTNALERFAELTRDLSVELDPMRLVGRAQEVVVALRPEAVCTYYELDGALWRLRSYRGTFRNPGLLAVLDQGLPRGATTNVDTPFDTGQPFYQDRYDPRTTASAANEARVMRSSAALPVFVHHHVRGVLVVGVHEARTWTPADRALLETVSRSLGIAMERAAGVAALSAQADALRRSNIELEQFAYVASHDLQAPVRAVTSFAEVMSMRYSDVLDARGRGYLRQIVENGAHMKRLLDDLLTYSRVTSETRPLVPTDTNAVFDVVLARMRPEVEARAATVTRSELPVVLADARQFDQLLQNLISNALKYHRPGVPPRVHVSAGREDTAWRFEVADNGIGIEHQYFGRIFGMFQRLHVRDAYEGTGVGLAVCQKIVERHGGRLWVESEPGRGSTFVFTLNGV